MRTRDMEGTYVKYASEVQELRGDSHVCCGRSLESGGANKHDPERTETGGGGVDGAECRYPVRCRV